MGSQYLRVVTVFIVIISTVAGAQITAQTNEGPVGVAPADEQFRTVEWIELLPADDLEALLNPPDYIDEIEDGSDEDQAAPGIQKADTPANDDRYQQALVSKRVNASLNSQPIRIPGFIVPLAFDGDQAVTEFFLVPYFGACLHLPPPPPNQIILVESAQGLKLEALNAPLWISGILSTHAVENEIASAAYSMALQRYELYE